MPDAFDLRVLLYSSAPSIALRALDKPGYSVCAVAAHEMQLFALLPELQPHIILFFDDTPNLPSILQHIRQLMCIAPPRIVCREHICESTDGIFSPQQLESLPQSLSTAFFKPLSALCADSANKRMDLAQALLTQLGMPNQLLGRHSIALSAAWLSMLPPPVPPLKHWLYPLLSQELCITPAAVERRIRSAIETTWLNGSIKAQGELFGFTVSAERGKPTNAEFLFLLTEHIRQRL